jgi:hypothetical protein
MKNKLMLSLIVVCVAYMSLGSVDANNNEYTVVPKSSDTKVAYIDRMYEQTGHLYVDVDFIEWYEGEEANVKFRQIEQDPEMTEAPDGYYIVNEDTKLEKFEVTDDAKVFMQIYNRTGDLEEAGTLWNEQIDAKKLLSLLNDNSDMSLKDYPYHLAIQNGKIVGITQQFIP